MKQTESEKTYIMELTGGGQRKITIPTSWKVTFGPTVPAARVSTCAWAVRVYESKDRQRAGFTDVISLRDMSIAVEERDMSIAVEEKRVSRQAKVLQKKTPQGMKDMHVEAVIAEWVNPDAPEDTSSNPFLLESGE